MKNFKKSNSKGFTIIEVLIVLAIAGLILLVVFLAVPALQRNARNTSRKSDASALLAAVTEDSSNNSGSLAVDATLTYTGSETTLGTAKVKSGYYNTGTVKVVTCADAACTIVSTAGTTTVDTLFIVKKATCTGNVISQGSGRSVAAYFMIEPSIIQCTAS